MASESAQYLATLHKQIDTYFSFNEVKTLCFDLGVDYENIPGDIRSAFIRNLIVSLAKQNRLQELVNKVRDERPFVDWQNVPVNFELPTSVAEEDIRQLVTYNVYGGDVVQGDKIGGDKIGGDKIGGNKIGGDNISVGNISGAEGIAIGGGASASVQKTTGQAASTPQSLATPHPAASTEAAVQQATNTLNLYLQIAANEDKAAADELSAAVTIILTVLAEKPRDVVHLKLLCLGQAQLAQNLAESTPGIERAVEKFITAVTPNLH